METYKFVVKDKSIIDTTSKMYANSEFEFSYKRIINSNGTFEEQGLFERGKSSVIFKKMNQDWYVKNRDNWNLFYSSEKQISPSIIINENTIKLLFIKTEWLYGLRCSIYKVKYDDKEVGGNIYYGFTPNKGIILIQTDEVELIRQDILSSSRAVYDADGAITGRDALLSVRAYHGGDIIKGVE